MSGQQQTRVHNQDQAQSYRSVLDVVVVDMYPVGTHGHGYIIVCSFDTHNRLRFTPQKFLPTICRPAYIVESTQLLPHPGHRVVGVYAKGRHTYKKRFDRSNQQNLFITVFC